MTTEQTNRIELLSGLGLSLISSPPMADVRDDWPNIAFAIQLLFKGKLVLSTDYRMGVGHVKWEKAHPDSIVQNWSDDERSLLYTKAKHPYAVLKNKLLEAQVARKLALQQKVTPQLDDVVHSLLLDGQAFFNAQSLEDWASEFGYDTDSRKCEAIYKACDDIGRKLAAALPREIIEKAQEITSEV